MSRGALVPISLRRNSTVRLGSPQSIIGNIEVADCRNYERVLDSSLVGQRADQVGYHGSAHNRGHNQSRALAGHRSQSGYAKRKDIWEHDRVEEPAQHQRSDSNPAGSEHGNDNQSGGGKAEDAQQLSGPDPGHDSGAKQPAHHGAAPVKRYQEGRRGSGAYSLRVEVIYRDRGQTNFHAHVEEDAQRGPHRVSIAPDAAAQNRVAFIAGAKGFGLGDRRQVRKRHRNPQYQQPAGDRNIGSTHRVRNAGLGGQMGQDQ